MSAAQTLSDGTSNYVTGRSRLLAGAGPGQARRRALSSLTDGWLADVFDAALRATGGGDATLVALGGYGRGELSPGSDLDLLLLTPRDAESRRLAALADAVWYPVWDSGVPLDHAVRTLDETRRLARADVTVLLGLLDARHVAGDVGAVEQLRSTILGDWRAGARRRLPELREDWEDRGRTRGDVRHDLEPDVKEGRGGLRDFVALRAIAASWLTDRPHELDDPVRWLADVRDALHDTTGRRGNRLALQEHDPVARLLGRDADGLLHETYAAASAVSHAADTTWRAAMRSIGGSRPRSSSRPVLRPLGPGMAEQDGEAVLLTTAAGDDPVLSLRLAARAARAHLVVATSSAERLARVGPDLPEPWPAAARDALVELLGAGASLVTVWEGLDHAGLVDRWLPEWGRVRNRPQRNPVHRFTVGRHLLETVVEAAELVRQVQRPDLLLVSALLHDIGKGRPGDHSVVGAELVRDVVTRLGWPPDDVRRIETLTRHHLLLARAATRRDPDDPATVDEVACVCRDRDTLDLLHALTVADARATGPAAWSTWRAGLVDDLVRRVRAQLSGGPPTLPREISTGHRSLLARGGLEVRLERADGGLWRVTVAAPERLGLFAAVAGVLALQRLSVRSARIHSGVGTSRSGAVGEWLVAPERDDEPSMTALTREIGRALSGELDLAGRLVGRDRDRRSARPAPSSAPAVALLVPDASRRATVVEVRAADRPGLLHDLGAVLVAHGADVSTACVDTWGAEAVDVFYLHNPGGGQLAADRLTGLLGALADAATAGTCESQREHGVPVRRE